jgi:hypothetical protein
MFIRFKKVRLASQYGIEDRYSIHAVLVESFRKDGKPRQRVLKYMGACREVDFNDPIKRRMFLELVRKKLDNLKLPPTKVAQIKVRLFHRSLKLANSSGRNT